MIVEVENPKSVGQIGRMEIQVRVDATVLSPKSTGRTRQAGNSGRVSRLQS